MRTRRAKNVQRAPNAAQLDLFVISCERPARAVAPAASAPSIRQPSIAAPQEADELNALVDYVLAPDRKRGRPEKQLNTGALVSTKRLLDVREAAQRLGLSKSTLDKMRCSGRGPRFIRATDRAIRYDPADLDSFAAERRRRSTSEEALAAING